MKISPTSPLNIVRTPYDFGGVGDGVHDDAAALNAMFAAVRTDLATQSGVLANATKIRVDLSGGRWRHTTPINATGIVCWNMVISGGMLIGECAGKPMLDLSNSRGYHITDTLFYGVESVKPSVPMQIARAATVGFCDNDLIENVTAFGYFSVAAHYVYGQETTTYQHCRFWNFHNDAYVAIFEGFDAHAQTSDFVTLGTGSKSYTNDNYNNCDFRYLPITHQFAVTAISKAASAVITCGAHNFAVNDIVIFSLVAGMTEINSVKGTISAFDATTITVNINSTGFTTYTSGGYVTLAMTHPGIYFSRGDLHKFNNCYLTYYGDDAVWIANTADLYTVNHLQFDFMIEGACARSMYRFITGTALFTIRDLSITGFNTNSVTSFLSTDASGAGFVRVRSSKFNITNHIVNTSLPFLDSPAFYQFRDADISYPTKAAINVSTANAFSGYYTGIDDGIRVEVGTPPMTAYTPTIGATSGTITAATVTGRYKQRPDKIVFAAIKAVVTTKGSGAGSLTFTLPVAASASAFIWHGDGRNANTGLGLEASINQAVSTTTMNVVITSTNLYPVNLDGDTITVNIQYEGV